MLRLIAGRIGLAALLLLAASFLIFVGVEALPGDFASTYLGQSATAEAVAAIRERLGLDRPVLVRYGEWLAGLLRGDFGASWASGQPVAGQVAGRLGNSLLLAGIAAAVAVPLSVGLGMVAVLFRDGIVDRAINVVSLAAISLPEFFVGYLLILVFAVTLGVASFPAVVYPGMSLSDRLDVLVLPAATLVLVVVAHMMRMTRAAILSVMDAPYVETAELKGMSRFRAILRPTRWPPSSTWWR